MPARSGGRHLPDQSWCTRIHLPVSASVLQGVAMGDDDLPVDRWCPLNSHHRSVTWASGSPKCALYESEPLAFRIRWTGLAARHLWRCLLRNLLPGHHEEQMGQVVPCENPVPHKLWASLPIQSLWDIPIPAWIDLRIHHRVSDNFIEGKHKACLRSQDVRLLYPFSWLGSLCFSVLEHYWQKFPEFWIALCPKRFKSGILVTMQGIELCLPVTGSLVWAMKVPNRLCLLADS